MNRAEMRDHVRRLLGIRPPIDTSDPDAKPGDEPLQQPYPHNALINQVIRSTAALLNATLGIVIDGTVREEHIPAQTANGPYQHRVGFEDDYGVLEAWWNDALLTPITFVDLDRQGVVWPAEPPSTPRYVIVEGMSLYLFPAPNAAGTLKLRCQRGMSGPISDTDTFHHLPQEFHELIMYLVVVELADSLADDIEMATRARAFTEKARVAVDAIARWVNTQNMRYQQSMTALPYRHGGR